MLKAKIRIKLVAKMEEIEGKQKDVAEILNVSPQRLSNWVNGESFPNLNEAFRLAKFLDSKVDDLWEYKE